MTRGALSIRAVLPLVLIGVFSAMGATGQSRETVVAALIDKFAQTTMQDEMGLSPCSLDRQYRPIARELANLGASALPQVLQVLDEFERSPSQSKFAININWLMAVYAQIQGQAAFDRLRRMTDNPAPEFARLARDGILGLSLGLTSYVSASGRLGRRIQCNRLEEPRDVLDQLIHAWIMGDRGWVEKSLSAHAGAALDESIPLSSRQGAIEPRAAVGFRFAVASPWAEPAASLTLTADPRAPDVTAGHPELDTLFTDGGGTVCGRHRVQFVASKDTYGQASYVVDNSDIADLMRTRSACVTKSGASAPI